MTGNGQHICFKDTIRQSTRAIKLLAAFQHGSFSVIMWSGPLIVLDSSHKAAEIKQENRQEYDGVSDSQKKGKMNVPWHLSLFRKNRHMSKNTSRHMPAKRFIHFSTTQRFCGQMWGVCWRNSCWQEGTGASPHQHPCTWCYCGFMASLQIAVFVALINPNR